MSVLSETGAQALLERTATPAWIIDAASARISAANGLGRTLLGAGSLLDAAMPAVRRLREIAAHPDEREGGAEALLFWTASGARRLMCEVSRLDSGSLVVVARDPAGPLARGPMPADRAPAPADEPDPSSSDAGVDSAPPPMDAAATLREIARRIREGAKALDQGERDQTVDHASAPAARGRLDKSAAAAPEAEVLAEAQSAVDLPAKADARTAATVPPQPSQPEPPNAELSPAVARVPSRLLAELAHELKSPLSAIVAASEVMRDERLGELGNARYRDYAADIHNGARHALTLIERMLSNASARAPSADEDGASYSKPADASEAQSRMSPVDVNALVEECLSAMQPVADQAGLRLDRLLERRLEPLVADATALRQVLLNLVTNAIKFTPSGGAVELVTAGGAAGAVVVEVRDTGPGMSAAEITRVLGATAAQSQPRARPGGGFGMGLPLVRELVEAQAGRLDIRSRPGRGTRVVMTFPRRRLVVV